MPHVQKGCGRTWDNSTELTPAVPTIFSEYLGIVARSHGLDGSFTLTDTVTLPTQLGPGSNVGIGFSRDFLTVFTIQEFSQSPTRTVIRLREVNSREEVQDLVDKAVFASINDVQLEPSERYRVGDIVGCTVVYNDALGLRQILGKVTDVLLLPANDVWVVTTPSAMEVLIPVVDHVIDTVDLVNHVIAIHLIDGLLDPEIDED